MSYRVPFDRVVDQIVARAQKDAERQMRTYGRGMFLWGLITGYVACLLWGLLS